MAFKYLALAFFVFLFSFSSLAEATTIQEHFKAAQKFYKSKQYRKAISEYAKVVDLLVKGGNKPVAQKIQMNIGVLYFIEGEFDNAITAYEKARHLNEKPNAKFEFKLLRNLASAHYKAGNYLTAAAIRESLLKHKGRPDGFSAVLWAEIAAAYRAAEIYSKAIAAYKKALSEYRRMGDEKKEALVLTSLGLCQAKLGRFSAAIDNLQQANKLAIKLKQPQTLAEANSNLGIIYWDMGRYEEALKYNSQAIDVETRTGLKENLGADKNNRGLIYKSSGNYPKALNSIEEAITIARQIKNPRDEAIALSNRALIRRIMGRMEEARSDYQAALAIYDSHNFEEGRASCYLGLGKLYEVNDQDYQKAYEYYRKALAIYQKLGNIGYEAEALNQIGRVLRKGINPSRTSRDLMFADDEPVFVKLPPKECIAKSITAYKKALQLGRLVKRPEVVWSALHGLGYAQMEQGRLEEALKNYRRAIDVVMSIRGGNSDSELLGDYLRDKEDLFTEAMAVCSNLYSKTNQIKYLKLQMEYQEIYKNEVMKGAMNAAKPAFADKEKAELFAKLIEIGAQKRRLEEAEGRLNAAAQRKVKPGENAKEIKKRSQVAGNEAVQVKIESKKLDQTFESLLKQWRQKYPADKGLFESAAKVDLDKIKSGLAANEALIQYFPLKDALSIICVTKEETTAAKVDIPYVELAKLIRDEFSYKQIELYGHAKSGNPEDVDYKNCLKVMERLYNVLIKPINKSLADKTRLVIVTSKYLSYVPFAALVSGFNEKGEPHFLVQDKTIAFIRLSFFDQYIKARTASKSQKNGKMLAVGNPRHQILKAGLPELEAAEAEVKEAVRTAVDMGLPKPHLMVGKAATEQAWRQAAAEGDYSIFYFATHGVPYAETLASIRAFEIRMAKWKRKAEEARKANKPDIASKYARRIKKYRPYLEFCRKVFTVKSPLYGYLYMAYPDKQNCDGVLTLKEIMELPDRSFAKARLAVLSACNTAVTYSPKISKEIRRELGGQDISQELVKAGWTPGVDQISLADTFMKRNFTSVLGTLWFADDQAAGFISSRFFRNLAEYSPAEALRQAQLAYLAKPPLGPDYTKTPKHPYYWAVAAVFGQ